MQTESISCHPCSQKGQSIAVEFLCSDCNQGLCASCLEEHKTKPENALHRITEAGSSRGCQFAATQVNTQSSVLKFNAHDNLPVPKFTHKGNFNIVESKIYISSMVVTNDNRVLICNVYANHLLVYNEIGTLVEKCHLKGAPWDISMINYGDKAVITLESRQALQFISTSPSVVAGKILPLKWKCYGVTVISSYVYLGGRGEIHILDNAGQHLSSVDAGHKGYIWYIQRGPNDNLFYTSFDFDEVACYDLKTKKEYFKYRNKTLKGPEAIAFDKSGYLFVACRDIGNIQRLTPGGEDERIVLKVDKPYGLAFNRSCSKLYVSNRDGAAVSIFDVQYE